jgi:hypothetical protein
MPPQQTPIRNLAPPPSNISDKTRHEEYLASTAQQQQQAALSPFFARNLNTHTHIHLKTALSLKNDIEKSALAFPKKRGTIFVNTSSQGHFTLRSAEEKSSLLLPPPPGSKNLSYISYQHNINTQLSSALHLADIFRRAASIALTHGP